MLPKASTHGFKLRLRLARKALHCRQLRENTAVVAAIAVMTSLSLHMVNYIIITFEFARKHLIKYIWSFV